MDASLAEPDGEHFIERVEPSYVGQDDHARRGRHIGRGPEGGELVAVGRPQDRVARGGGAKDDRWRWRSAGGIVAHLLLSLA
jgi:hypothetical protein